MFDFIDTRAAAEKEGRNEIRRGKKTGAVPKVAAAQRRYFAEQMKEIAKGWHECGNDANALHCFKVARGHYIVARMWDREAEKPWGIEAARKWDAYLEGER